MAAREEEQEEKKEKAKFGRAQAGKTEAKEKPKARLQQKIDVKKTGKEKEHFRGIVRIVGKDLKGHVTVKNALRQVPGIGHNLAASLIRGVMKNADFASDELVGNLSDEQLSQFEVVIKDPQKFGVPAYLLNRPLDPETGKPVHRVMAELTFSVRQDINKEKDLRSYRGWRHQMGQKVRGQRTRSTGRTGMSVGVLKKAAAKKGAVPAEGAKEEKK
ncbi:30S ribosomal protein S13 [Candidatus Micrarchaeota archaeon]|nr:30S ribosomal protein S13 [Candidatus Micrarchaeota archaeon]